MDPRLLKLLTENFEQWKIAPSGQIVALTHPHSYTNSRLVAGIDLVGYHQCY